MLSIEQLKVFMEEKFGVAVESDGVGEESVLLYHEELDEELISIDVKRILPNPVSFQTYIYNEESEWIVGVATVAETNSPLFLICLKDGNRIYEEVLFRKKDNEK
ncbi:hypothetical protein ACQCWA_20845 [Rossellomorea aquimaris]|uniref:hypothetical protein n=1 Tax=Rossellomorea aquimaris TaxID=189382 RepID=UPI003CE69A55